MVDFVKDPPLFGTQHDMRSLLICTKLESKKETSVHAYDIFKEISQYCKPKKVNTTSGEELSEYPFISCIVNWFGKSHGMMYYGKPARDDIWAFVNNLTLVLKFGWPLSRWNRMKPTGTVVKEYIHHCVSEANKLSNIYTSVNVYQNIISKFGKAFLNQEMVNATKFYVKATRAELDKNVPLEMHEFMERSEMHTQNALRMFTQSIAEALFSHQVVGEIETQMKTGINTNFRPIWRENGQISENYCQKIFDSCFKWVTAEVDCVSNLFTLLLTVISLQNHLNPTSSRKLLKINFMNL